MHCKHAQQVIICKDKATIAKRKRFGFCKLEMWCCVDCPYLPTCQFVCPKLGEDEDESV